MVHDADSTLSRLADVGEQTQGRRSCVAPTLGWRMKRRWRFSSDITSRCHDDRDPAEHPGKGWYELKFLLKVEAALNPLHEIHFEC